jgi:hypothetical protein
MIVAGYALLRSLRLKPHYTKTNLTISSINAILRDFDCLNKVDARALISNLQPPADSLTVNRQLAAFLRSNKSNVLPLDNLISSDGFFRDGWGTPLCFILTNDIAISNLNPQLQFGGRPFVVWSAGANQKDELGFGDDLSPDKP